MWAWLVANVSKTVIIWTCVGVTLVGGYGFIKYQGVKIKGLQADKQTLEQAIQEQAQTIDQLKKDYDAVIKAKEEHQQVINNTHQSNTQFQNTVAHTQTELQYNQVTTQLFRCIEIATGAENKNGLVC